MANMNVAVVIRLVDQLSGQAARVQNSLAGINSKIMAIQGAAMAAAAGMGRMGEGMIASGATMAFAFGGALVGVGSKLYAFEKNMNRARAVTDATDAQFAEMRKTATHLGATTQFSASQAAEGLVFLGMAGLGAEKSVAALPHALALAASSNIDLGRAADIVTNIMSAYGKEASQLARVNDVLATAQATSNTNLVELSEGMKMVGPASSAFGVSLETTTASLMILANKGIKGTLAGTGVRRAFAGLAKNSKATQKVLNRLGIRRDQLVDGKGHLKDFADIIDLFNEKGATMSDLFAIFGDRAGPIMAALMEEGGEKLREFTRRLQESEGRAKKMQDTLMSGLPGAVKYMTSALEGVILKMGEVGLTQDLIDLSDWITSFARRMQESYPTVLRWAGRILVAGAVLGALLVPLGLAVIAIGALLPVLLGGISALLLFGQAAVWLGRVMMLLGAVALTNPIGMIAAAVAALAAAGYLLYQNWGAVTAWFSGIWATMAGAVSSAVIGIVSAVQGLWQRITSVDLSAMLSNLVPQGWWQGALALLQAGWNAIVGVFEAAAARIRGIIAGIRGAISGIGSAIGGALSGSAAKGGSTGAEFGGARAAGGPVAAGKTYLVGERGPELVTFDRAGYVTPNHAIGDAPAGRETALRGGGGGPVNVSMTFHVNGNADPQAIARIVTARMNAVARGALYDGVYD